MALNMIERHRTGWAIIAGAVLLAACGGGSQFRAEHPSSTVKGSTTSEASSGGLSGTGPSVTSRAPGPGEARSTKPAGPAPSPRDGSGPTPAQTSYCDLAGVLFGDEAPAVYEDDTGPIAVDRFRAYVGAHGAQLDQVADRAPADIRPDVAVVVATFRAVAQSGDLTRQNSPEFRAGQRHLDAYNLRACPS